MKRQKMLYVKENRLFRNFFTLADFGLGKENNMDKIPLVYGSTLM